jgi:hypothetical protein
MLAPLLGKWQGSCCGNIMSKEREHRCAQHGDIFGTAQLSRNMFMPRHDCVSVNLNSNRENPTCYHLTSYTGFHDFNWYVHVNVPLEVKVILSIACSPALNLCTAGKYP